MPPELLVTPAEVALLRAQVELLEQQVHRQEREIDQIAEIHQALLPSEMPAIRGMELSASHHAPHKAGGDYYDLIPLRRLPDTSPDPDAGYLLVIADASGHGPAAAMIMAMLQAVLHAYVADSADPGVVMQFINDQMAQKQVGGSFTTAILAVLDPHSSTLAYTSAGHHPPMLRHSDGTVEMLSCDNGGPPLAVVPEARIGSHFHTLRPGDTVLLYTDGAVEATNLDGEQFGMARLREALAAAEGSPQEILDAVNAAIFHHCAGAMPEDDKTLLAIRYHGEPSQEPLAA